MQIVIDVSEEEYDAIKSGHPVFVTVQRGGGKLLTIDLFKAVRNGTPLPKGHGALKDADIIIEAIKKSKKFFVDSWGGFEHMPLIYKARCDEIDNCVSEVLNAPTIIEADKEVDNAELQSNP